MHTLDRTLLHINIDLWSEPILFSQLILVGLLDCMIHLCCTNLDHDSSYLEALACIDTKSYQMLARVASKTVSSSHYMSSIHFHDILWYQPPELQERCVDFIPGFHNFIIENS